jgi:hypothetical protein
MRTGACLLGVLSAILSFAVSATATADPAADAAALVREGEALARQAQYGEAIARFRAADALLPRAAHACLIALAYRKREDWARAQLHVARCHDRAAASSSDPEPAWAQKLRDEIAARLRPANLAPLLIDVQPPEARAVARIVVSAFGPDEPLEPRTIFLPVGVAIEVAVEAPGYQPMSRVVKVDATGMGIQFRMVPPAPVTEAPAVTEGPPASEAPAATEAARSPDPEPPVGAAGPAPAPAPELAPAPLAGSADTRRAGRSWTTYAALGTAAVALGTGVTFHILAADTRGQLADARTGAEWDLHEADFDRERLIALAGYGVAIVAGAIGVRGLLVDPPRDSDGARLGAALAPGATGGIVTLEWRR